MMGRINYTYINRHIEYLVLKNFDPKVYYRLFEPDQNLNLNCAKP